MNIKKLFFLFFISFCLQAPAEDFYNDPMSTCNNEFVEQNKIFDCSQKSKKDYLNNLKLFENYLESMNNDGLIDDWCFERSIEDRPDPICPIPLPQFYRWTDQYRSLCSVVEDFNLKDQISSLLKDKPDPICPIPLPQFNQLVKEYNFFCSQPLNQPLNLERSRPAVPSCSGPKPLSSPTPLRVNDDFATPPKSEPVSPLPKTDDDFATPPKSEPVSPLPKTDDDFATPPESEPVSPLPKTDDDFATPPKSEPVSPLPKTDDGFFTLPLFE